MATKPAPRRRATAVLVTPDRCVREESRAFGALIGEHAPDWDATRFAVVNLGFLVLRRDGSRLDIIVHPRTADAAAVDAALTMAGISGAAVFTIAWLGPSAWQWENFTSAREACARLMEVCSRAYEPRVETASDGFPEAVAPAFCRS